MNVVASLLRILAALLLIRLAFRFAAGVVQGLRGSPSPASSELVRDRVCNTFVPRDRAIEAVVTGRAEHFCSTACRDLALARAALR